MVSSGRVQFGCQRMQARKQEGQSGAAGALENRWLHYKVQQKVQRCPEAQCRKGLAGAAAEATSESVGWHPCQAGKGRPADSPVHHWVRLSSVVPAVTRDLAQEAGHARGTLGPVPADVRVGCFLPAHQLQQLLVEQWWIV